MSILGLSRISCHVSLTLNHVDGKIILIVVIFVVVVVGVVVGDAVATWGLTTIFPIEPYCLFLFRLFGTWKFPRSRTPSESQTCSRCAAAISFSFVVFLDTLGYRHFSKLLVEPRVVYLNPQHSTARVLFFRGSGGVSRCLCEWCHYARFFPLIFGMIFGICFKHVVYWLFFHVASILLHFGSRFFFHRSRFPQRFSAGAFFSFRSVPQFWVCFRCVVCVFPLFVGFVVFFPLFSWPRWHGGDVEAWAWDLRWAAWERVILYIYIYIALGIDIIWEVLFFRILEVISSELQGGRGGGGDCLKNGTFEGKMKGETLAKFLRYIFVIFFGHVGAGGAAVQINNIFFEDFACWSVFAMIENRGKKQGFAPRSGDERNSEGPKNRCTKTIFFEINRFERATHAKKKRHIFA